MRISIHSSDESIGLADWLEALMVVDGCLTVSRSTMRRHLRGSVSMDSGDLDVTIELLTQEVSRRRQVAGKTYPFSVESGNVRLALSGDSLCYVFLLCISTSAPLRCENRQGEVELLLDMVVLDALCGYLSGGSRGVHFGWPTSGDRPPSFPAAIEWLANHLGLRLGKGEKRAARKDAGVDVVVWRPFRDQREGFATILAQCTSAIDWTEKGKDIVTDLWRGYIDFGKDPITCLAIPFVIPRPFDKWDELRRTVHFVLDRLRICELLEDVDLTVYEQVEEWTCTELRSMGQVADEENMG